MRKRIFIELLEEHEKVNIYSIRHEGEEFSEFEKFLLSHKEGYRKDLGVLSYRLDRIIQDGVFERHFRYEGKMKDRVSAIPSHFDVSNLRVYCICLTEKIIILGTGCIKKTRTYNENILLDKIVVLMQEIDSLIRLKERAGNIKCIGNSICGELFIDIDFDKEIIL